MVRHTKKGIMPQTPNNAPTYKQQLLFTVHGNSVSQSAIQTLSSSLERVFHPDNFQFKKAGSMTLAYSTNHKGATAPQK